MLGRLTTMLQIAAVLTVLIARSGVAVPPLLLEGLFVVTALATVASGIDYVRVWAERARRKRSASR